jgi:hypothetical protein
MDTAALSWGVKRPEREIDAIFLSYHSKLLHMMRDPLADATELIQDSFTINQHMHRLHSLSLSQIHKEQELNNILYIARQNGYPTTLIKKLNNNILNTKKTMRDIYKHTQDDNKTWVIF